MPSLAPLGGFFLKYLVPLQRSSCLKTEASLVATVSIFKMHFFLQKCTFIFLLTNHVLAGAREDLNNARDLIRQETNPFRPKSISGQGIDCANTLGFDFQQCGGSNQCYSPTNEEACCVDGDSACQCCPITRELIGFPGPVRVQEIEPC